LSSNTTLRGGADICEKKKKVYIDRNIEEKKGEGR
jgi:hypothetical protein